MFGGHHVVALLQRGYKIQGEHRLFLSGDQVILGPIKKAGHLSGLESLFESEGLFAAVATATAALTAISTVAATAIATTTTTASAAETTAAAASTATAATTTAAITATAAFTFGAGGPLFTRTGNVHRQGASFDLMAMIFFHAFLGLFPTSHGDEGETAGTTGELVEDDFDDTDGANLAEQGFEILGSGGEGKIPDVEL